MYQHGWEEVEEAIQDNKGVINFGGFKIQFGRVSGITVPASSYTAIEVPFDEAFNTIPVIVTQQRGNYNTKSDVSSNTKTGFTMNVRSVDGIERTSRSFDWIAIGS